MVLAVSSSKRRSSRGQLTEMGDVMATTVVRVGSIVSRDVKFSEDLGGIERYVIRHAHPISLYFEMVGLIWLVFFLWEHLWKEAVAAYLAARMVGLLAVYRADVRALAQTMLGKIALLHLHGINFFVQLLGSGVALYGVWWHDVRTILAGVSVIFLGHIQGWAAVDDRFEIK